MEINPNVKYEKEPNPAIKGEHTVWFEDYEADLMKFIKEWGIEANVPIDAPYPVKMVRPTLSITAPEVPSTSVPEVPLQHPTTIPPVSNQKITFPQPDAVSSGKVEKDNEREIMSVIDLKDELYSSQRRLTEANGIIESLRSEMIVLEADEWKARVDSLWLQIKNLEKDRITVVLSSSSDDQTGGDNVV
ncbi:hypothetical protein Dimus_013801 [Dionaea muscipula]